MYITIINQHSNNRGDEAQLLSTLHNIQKFFPDVTRVNVIYNNSDCGINTSQFPYEIKHIHDKKISFFLKLITFICIFIPMKKIYFVNNKINIEDIFFKSILFINAAGGSNLGVYKDWKYLFRLRYLQKFYKKTPLVSMGNSIEKSNSFIFNFFANKTLKKFNLLLLREKISCEHANQNYISFVKTSDIVLSDNFIIKSKINNKIYIKNKKTVAISLNNLSEWHPKYKHYSFTNELINIFNMITYDGYDLLFLPQLFGYNNNIKNSDLNFYNSIFKKLDNKNNLHIIKESHSVMDQISLIKDCNFLIGFRYHSIIYSIRNHIPFISINYESKMNGLLQDSKLEKLGIDIDQLSTYEISKKIKYIHKNYKKLKKTIIDYHLTSNNLINENMKSISEIFNNEKI